jgi:hypothetical protein
MGAIGWAHGKVEVLEFMQICDGDGFWRGQDRAFGTSHTCPTTPGFVALEPRQNDRAVSNLLEPFSIFGSRLPCRSPALKVTRTLRSRINRLSTPQPFHPTSVSAFPIQVNTY